MFNKIVILGNLTRDIEMKFTSSGLAVANTAIASTKKFKAQDGTQKEEVMFVNITFFGRIAEIAQQYLRKGSKVLVEGRLKFDKWTDQNGQKHSKHSVSVETMQMLDTKGSNQSTDTSQPPQDSTPKPSQDSTPKPSQDSTPKPSQDSTPPPVDDKDNLFSDTYSSNPETT